MPVHIGSKKINSIHVGTKKVLTAWVGTNRVYSASTLSMLIDGYTEVSGNNLLSANTPLKFTGDNELGIIDAEKSLVTALNGKISFSGTSTGGTNIYLQLKSPISVKVGETITMALLNPEKLAEANYVTFYLAQTQSSTGSLEMAVGSANVNAVSTKVISSDVTYNYLRIYITGGRTLKSYATPMLIKGSTAPTVFEPYHETLYNPTVPFSLNAVNETKDTFETISGKLIKRTGIRDYQDGDENNPDVVTNGTVTIYKLTEPVEYDKLTKTLPQWVKHVFDSSGRELEATITQ